MKPEDLARLMRRRRSVRDYLPDPVPDEILQQVLDAATLAPSGADRLPHAVVAVSGAEMKERIRAAAEEVDARCHESMDQDLKAWMAGKNISHEKPFLTGAPLLLVLAGDTTQPYWRESVWLAVAYMLLAIEARGLGSLTYTPEDTGFLKEMLGFPDHFSVEVVLPVGCPAQRLPPKKARSAGRVFSGRYGQRF